MESSEDLINFSRNLILVRKYVNVTQFGLADKLGLKANTVSNYEKEVSMPDYKALVKICKLFCLSVDAMLNEVLTISDLEAKPEWLQNVRRNFNLNDVDVPARVAEMPAEALDLSQFYMKQMQDQLDHKDEVIATLNKKIGRLELIIEQLQKGE